MVYADEAANQDVAHLHRNESPKMTEPRILIVDDEPKLLRLAQEVLCHRICCSLPPVTADRL